MKNKKRIVIYMILNIAVMAAIFMFSAQSAESSTAVSEGLLAKLGGLIDRILPSLTDQGWEHDIRKYAHMFEFMCLGVSSSLLIHELFNNKRVAASFAAAESFCFAYAASDEIHQLLVPGRSGQIKDVFIDSIGFTTGIIIVLLISSVRIFLGNKRIQDK